MVPAPKYREMLWTALNGTAWAKEAEALHLFFDMFLAEMRHGETRMREIRVAVEVLAASISLLTLLFFVYVVLQLCKQCCPRRADKADREFIRRLRSQAEAGETIELRPLKS